jgi:hypothetical protein
MKMAARGIKLDGREDKKMDAITTLTTETERLLALANEPNPYETSFAELKDRQLAAINERFQDRLGSIKLLQNRAEEGNVSSIQSMHDVIPLLFAHTTYKSYPESWLFDGKWDRMGKWLDTVSTYRVQPMDTAAVKGLDHWLEMLEEQGHFVACSSGTTGKCAMMNAAQSDLDFGGKSLLDNIIWCGLSPNNDRMMISMGGVAATAKNRATGMPMMMAMNNPGVMPFAPQVPPMTIGSIVDAVVIRKRIAEGTAQPSDIAKFDEQAQQRAEANETSIEQVANAIIEHRHERLHLMGLFGMLIPVAHRVRAKGFSGKDFQANSLFLSGGLKRTAAPDGYKELVFETFNLMPENIAQTYGMQELNSNAVGCSEGRYHMPPWVMFLLLDESGENLIEPPAKGEVEGRAAFYDLSLDGRWGGIISGDRVRAQWEPCACGNRSPSIHNDIQRYADGPGGDKIACSGNIDAYVRGVS